MMHGLYNQNLQAVPPTGSISYINNATSSIHPIVSRIEIRKEGKIGRVYYPAPYMTNDNPAYYRMPTRLARENHRYLCRRHATRRSGAVADVVLPRYRHHPRHQPRADLRRRKGIKTIYYIRLRQMALEGTEVQGCVSCAL